MRRLSVRLVASHLAVALLGALVTFVVVRQLAPALFDQSLRMSPGGGAGRGPGTGPNAALREQFASAVDQALLLGALVGVALAAVLGVVAATRLVRPLSRVREATRRIAAGEYAVSVPAPGVDELSELASDVNTLGHALADTETRRVRLLGEVAHELRTPLTVIDGYLEGMQDGVLPVDAGSLNEIGAETRRLRRLAEDLSALSHAEEGRLAVSLTRLDLRTPVVQAAERLRPQAEDAGLTLLTAPDDQPVLVDADADRIAQVVTNLVGNAIRATPPGGSVTVSCAVAGDRATIRVADTGEGIAADDLTRIFERFYRVADRRTTGTDSGSGIGLTIARGLLRAQGGDLTAASGGKGAGSTFTATMPLAS